MFTLGIHGGMNSMSAFESATPINWLHDAAAVLCRDGDVVAASEEERFVRIKHASHFPLEAIRYCLESQRISLKDVHAIVLSSQLMNDFLTMVNRWRHGTRAWLADSSFEVFASRVLAEEFGVDVRDRVRIGSHHASHALGAVWQSGMTECLCVVLDGWGDGLTGVVFSWRDGQLTALRSLHDVGPAGMYLLGTEILGFAQFDEYKVMGLAPYGDAAIAAAQSDALVALKPEGEFAVSLPALRRLARTTQAFREREVAIEQRHKDFAATIQAATEKALLHLLTHFRRQTGHRNLCMAGGLAQNCTANGKVLSSGLFGDVFVQPAAYDAGCAIGAAIDGYLQAGGRMTSKRLAHVYWGRATEERDALAAQLHAWADVAEITEMADECATAARLIAEGRIIGWVQGRAEFGARALGNRSILADPRPASNRTRINAMVKKRESFRPFAPSVLQEYLDEYFDLPPGDLALPFMVFVVPVRERYRSLLGAVTHVDGSARVQSVSRATNEQFWRLIDGFRQLAGIPVVLNTSFNNNAEPIVNTPCDAMNCYLSTEIDDLVIGPFLVRRKAPVQDRWSLLAGLVPRLSHRFALMQAAGRSGAVECSIQDRYTNARLPVSEVVHRWLSDSAARQLAFGETGDATAGRAAVDELFALWSRRVFVAERARAVGTAAAHATASASV
jgi:carbamoyltransferase